MFAPLHLAAAAAALALGGAAEACRIDRPPQARLATAYKMGTISAVALVRITGSIPLWSESRNARPWQASARVERVLRGSFPRTSVTFRRGWGSAACDDGLPRPRPGDLWVVYIGKRARPDLSVLHSYPADIAFAADPRLPRRSR